VGYPIDLRYRQLAHFAGLPIYGGKDCEAVTNQLKDGDSFRIGQGISAKALHTPCHTQDSICYFLEDGDDRAVFTGDTLFIGGVWNPMHGRGAGVPPSRPPPARAATR
jgi:glyoxylase-like metal-dependent hydrolase (beta-lactamase superfamily II)